MSFALTPGGAAGSRKESASSVSYELFDALAAEMGREKLFALASAWVARELAAGAAYRSPSAAAELAETAATSFARAGEEAGQKLRAAIAASAASGSPLFGPFHEDSDDEEGAAPLPPAHNTSSGAARRARNSPGPMPAESDTETEDERPTAPSGEKKRTWKWSEAAKEAARKKRAEKKAAGGGGASQHLFFSDSDEDEAAPAAAAPATPPKKKAKKPRAAPGAPLKKKLPAADETSALLAELDEVLGAGGGGGASAPAKKVLFKEADAAAAPKPKRSASLGVLAWMGYVKWLQETRPELFTEDMARKEVLQVAKNQRAEDEEDYKHFVQVFKAAHAAAAEE